IAHINVAPLFAKFDADLGRADVRRLGDDLLDGEITVRLVVVQISAGIIKMPVLAIEHVSQSHGSLVERGADHHDFKSRTRLRYVRYYAISARVGRSVAG